MDKFFNFISRIANLLVLIAFLVMGWFMWKSAQWEPKNQIHAVNQQTNSPVTLRLGEIEHIKDADTDMFRLYVHENDGKLSSGSYGSDVTRNILFISGSDKKARWLFPDQGKIIISVAKLHKNNDGENNDGNIKVLYFEIVSEDSNGDGELTGQDNSNVALARPDGLGIKEILHGISNVLSYEIINDSQLTIVYQLGVVVKYSRFSLSNFEMEKDVEIANIPTHL